MDNFGSIKKKKKKLDQNTAIAQVSFKLPQWSWEPTMHPHHLSDFLPYTSAPETLASLCEHPLQDLCTGPCPCLKILPQISSHLTHFPDGSAGQESACNAWDIGNTSSIPGSGRSPGGGNGNSFQYSCLETPWTEEPGGLPWARKGQDTTE